MSPVQPAGFTTVQTSISVAFGERPKYDSKKRSPVQPAGFTTVQTSSLSSSGTTCGDTTSGLSAPVQPAGFTTVQTSALTGNARKRTARTTRERNGFFITFLSSAFLAWGRFGIYFWGLSSFFKFFKENGLGRGHFFGNIKTYVL